MAHIMLSDKSVYLDCRDVRPQSVTIEEHGGAYIVEWERYSQKINSSFTCSTEADAEEAKRVINLHARPLRGRVVSSA